MPKNNISARWEANHIIQCQSPIYLQVPRMLRTYVCAKLQNTHVPPDKRNKIYSFKAKWYSYMKCLSSLWDKLRALQTAFAIVYRSKKKWCNSWIVLKLCTTRKTKKMQRKKGLISTQRCITTKIFSRKLCNLILFDQLASILTVILPWICYSIFSNIGLKNSTIFKIMEPL